MYPNKGLNLQAQGVLIEYENAVRRLAWSLQKNIRNANLDLTSKFDEIDSQYQDEKGENL